MVDGIIEGIVEKIGFRSTAIRKFDKSLAIIPNFQFAEKAVINNSLTTNRRISWIIGLEYKTTSVQLTNIKKEIISFIEGSDDFSKSKDTLLSLKCEDPRHAGMGNREKNKAKPGIAVNIGSTL